MLHFPLFLVSLPTTLFLVIISRKTNVYVHTCKYVHPFFSLSLCMYNSTYSIKVFIEHKEFKYVYIYTYVLEFFI